MECNTFLGGGGGEGMSKVLTVDVGKRRIKYL